MCICCHGNANTEILLGIVCGYTYIQMDGGFMKFVIEIASGIQKFIGWDTQHGDIICLLLFIQNMEIKL
jgi:hypothetical protein